MKKSVRSSQSRNTLYDTQNKNGIITNRTNNNNEKPIID